VTLPLIGLYLRGRKRARILVVCGNYLLVNKAWLSNGQWALPGGGLHKGETSLDAVLRELYEETGLRLQPNRVRRHSEQEFQGNGLHFNYVLFMAEVRRKAPLRPQPLEITNVEWVHRRELTPANARQDVLTALEAHWPRHRDGDLLQ
jgi:8-oxo-dGTP pyrophosphatase MutT (NUDIX family)